MKFNQLFKSFKVYFLISFTLIFFATYWREKVVEYGQYFHSDNIDVVEGLDLWVILMITLYISFMLSTFSSLLDVFVFKRLLHKRSLGYVIVASTIIQLFVIVLVVLNTNSIVVEFLFEQHNSVHKSFLESPDLILLVILMLFILFLSRFILEIDRKLGQGNLWKFLTGKFYKPHPERRLFMFIDLKASTTIAEQIGHYKFSLLIQDCFKDISVVQVYDAEVYQYVGDEVVLTWSPENGLKRNNYIHAFYAFKNVLESKRSYYQKKYGIFPEFKAGANIGDCTVTEVGELKREICYHGDTLNTTARIESVCNDYKADLLISEYLEKETDKLIYFNKEEVGNFALRGKKEKVKLYKITPHEI